MDKIEKDMIHNIEELAELQKELTKFLRGKLRREKLIEEIADVEIVLKNIKKYFDIKELEMIKIWGKKQKKIHEE